MTSIEGKVQITCYLTMAAYAIEQILDHKQWIEMDETLDSTILILPEYIYIINFSLALWWFIQFCNFLDSQMDF